MTVTVETPEGLKTGSAGREVIRHGGLYLPDSGPHYELKGEAVVVDLGKRGKLFATLQGIRLGIDPDYGRSVIFTLFPGKGGPPKKTEKITLQLSQYPMFVAFKDIKDPLTVQQVLEVTQKGRNQYAVAADHAEEIFGVGVKIKGVTIEMTDTPVTQQIGALLPWLHDYYNKTLDGQIGFTAGAKNPVANSLMSFAFKRPPP